MPAANRNDVIAKLQKVARKHFQPAKGTGDRSVFETVIFGCCLENASFEQAEEAFARLQENYFDWNEVRVTTVPELAESMAGFLDPSASATRVKKSLHSIFETHYAFDLESLRKENLGKAIEKLKSYKGVTEFVANYVAHAALGAHTIPIDEAMMRLFSVLDLVSTKDRSAGVVPGLERAVPKAKGSEFFTTVHPLAVQLLAAPNSTKVWAIVAEVDPDARHRYQQAQKAAEAAAVAAAQAAEARANAAKLATRTATPKNQPSAPKGQAVSKPAPAAKPGKSEKPAAKPPTKPAAPARTEPPLARKIEAKNEPKSEGKSEAKGDKAKPAVKPATPAKSRKAPPPKPAAKKPGQAASGKSSGSKTSKKGEAKGGKPIARRKPR